jgi:hypothetical protein
VGVVLFGTNSLVTQNYFHDGTMVVNTPGGTDDYGANGLVVLNSNHEVSYNLGERLQAPSYDFGNDGGFLELYGTISNVSVHHNVIRDSNGVSEQAGTIAHVVFAYNLGVHNGGFATLQNGSGNAFQDVQFLNNTIVEDSGTIFWFAGNGTSEFTFRNNLASLGGGKVFIRPGAAGHDHNVFGLTGGANVGVTADATETLASPAFVNAAGGDYRLTAGSPAIDKGVANAFAVDLDGKPVPLGSAPDVGAYEYGVVPIDAGTFDGGSVPSGDGGSAPKDAGEATADGGRADEGDAAGGVPPIDAVDAAIDEGSPQDSSSSTESGCAMRRGGDAPRPAALVAGIFAALSLASRRRRFRERRSRVH